MPQLAELMGQAVQERVLLSDRRIRILEYKVNVLLVMIMILGVWDLLN